MMAWILIVQRRNRCRSERFIGSWLPRRVMLFFWAMGKGKNGAQVSFG